MQRIWTVLQDVGPNHLGLCSNHRTELARDLRQLRLKAGRRQGLETVCWSGRSAVAHKERRHFHKRQVHLQSLDWKWTCLSTVVSRATASTGEVPAVLLHHVSEDCPLFDGLWLEQGSNCLLAARSVLPPNRVSTGKVPALFTTHRIGPGRRTGWPLATNLALPSAVSVSVCGTEYVSPCSCAARGPATTRNVKLKIPAQVCLYSCMSWCNLTLSSGGTHRPSSRPGPSSRRPPPQPPQPPCLAQAAPQGCRAFAIERTRNGRFSAPAQKDVTGQKIRRESNGQELDGNHRGVGRPAS